MELITREQFALLLLNGAAYDADSDENAKPVIKLINPAESETWLIVSVNPDDPDTAHCLYISGVGLPELKNISIEEMVNYQHPDSGEKIVRDMDWTADKTLNEYYVEAQNV